jgi:hypothetical protein
MTEDEWKMRCAARYIECSGLSQEEAEEAAEIAFLAQDGVFCKTGVFNPEDCADEDWTYWIERWR